MCERCSRSFTRAPGRFAFGQHGTAAIEYSIILPVLLLFLLGIMDTGRLLWTYSTLYRATEAAARCAAVNKTACVTASQIQNDAVAEAWELTIAPSAFTVSSPSCGVQVRGTFDFAFTVVPGLSPVTLKATACYPPQ